MLNVICVFNFLQKLRWKYCFSEVRGTCTSTYSVRYFFPLSKSYQPQNIWRNFSKSPQPHKALECIMLLLICPFADRQKDRNATIPNCLTKCFGEREKKSLLSSCPFVRPSVLQPLTFASTEDETFLSGNIRVTSQKTQIVPNQLSLD
jgi:hypothetical protein